MDVEKLVYLGGAWLCAIGAVGVAASGIWWMSHNYTPFCSEHITINDSGIHRSVRCYAPK